MAIYEEHCRDCERILGNKYEEVNRWIDELFTRFGAKHRKYRHCWKGVREAQRLWGIEGAKAAIIHIVRDCGAVPKDSDYIKTTLGIIADPDQFLFDGVDEKAFNKFKRAVEKEFEKL